MDITRSFRRSEIKLRCPCRTLDGVPLELELLDLSERGCRAHPIGIVLHFGQALRLFPEGCDAFTATVRRSDGEVIGIEFDRELPNPIFERMRCYAPEPEEMPEKAYRVDAPEATEVTETKPEADPDAPDASKPQAYGSLLANGPDKRRMTKKMALG